MNTARGNHAESHNGNAAYGRHYDHNWGYYAKRYIFLLTGFNIVTSAMTQITFLFIFYGSLLQSGDAVLGSLGGL